MFPVRTNLPCQYIVAHALTILVRAFNDLLKLFKCFRRHWLDVKFHEKIIPLHSVVDKLRLIRKGGIFLPVNHSNVIILRTLQFNSYLILLERTPHKKVSDTFIIVWNLNRTLFI